MFWSLTALLAGLLTCPTSVDVGKLILFVFNQRPIRVQPWNDDRRYNRWTAINNPRYRGFPNYVSCYACQSNRRNEFWDGKERPKIPAGWPQKPHGKIKWRIAAGAKRSCWWRVQYYYFPLNSSPYSWWFNSSSCDIPWSLSNPE